MMLAFLSDLARAWLFRVVFLCVLVMLCSLSFYDTLSRVHSFSRAAIVSLDPSDDSRRYGIDPFLTELEIVSSEPVLKEAAVNLNLGAEWATKSNRGGTLGADRVVDRLRKGLTLTRYSSSKIEIRAQGESPEQATRIANEIASVYCKFNSRNSNAPNYLAVNIVSLAEVVPARAESRGCLRLLLELGLAVVLAFVAVVALRVVLWLLNVSYPIVLRDLFRTNFSGKIVGALWLSLGAAVGLFWCGLFALDIWSGHALTHLSNGVNGTFWLVNAIAGIFLARNQIWARIYLMVAGAFIIFVPFVTNIPFFLFFHGYFVWFSVGSICALLLPQKLDDGAPEVVAP